MGAAPPRRVFVGAWGRVTAVGATLGQRIAMMWELAESAWKLAGRSMPTYTRANMPSALFKPGAVRPDSDDA